MARRRQHHVPQGKKSALGYGYSLAETKIGERRTAAIYTMVAADAKFTPEQVVPMFIPEDIRQLLRDALPYVEADNNYKSYPLGAGVSVRVARWADLGLCAPKEQAVKVDETLTIPLIELGVAVRKIAFQWAKVRHVLEWMDVNATPAAIRYYWPAVMSLIPPEFNKIEGELSDRHRTPTGINQLMPLIRETAGIVASGLLIPETEKPSNYRLALTVAGQTLDVGGVSVTSPQVEVHLP